MEWSEYASMLTEKCCQSRIPSSAAFELTPLCNFNCNMCYVHLTVDQARRQGRSLTTDQWLSLAQDAKRQGTLSLEITGGEATTRPDFAVLYEAFIKMGYLVTLRTNGYAIRGDILDLLHRYKPMCVSISLYGASDSTYKTVCGVHDGFSVVSKNILALKEAGIRPRLTMTLTKENYGDRDLVAEWAYSHEMNIGFYGSLITPIRSAYRSIDDLRVEYEFLQESDDEVCSRIVENPEKYLHPFWMCKSYGSRFCITWDGRMTLCNCLPTVWSEPLQEGIREAFDELYVKLDQLERPSECVGCQYSDYCPSCPARLLSETGSHSKTSAKLCNIAKSYYQSEKRALSRLKKGD